MTSEESMMKQQKALKNSNKAWAAAPLVYAACLLSIFTVSPSSLAAETHAQKLVYEVYAGGIHAVQSTVEIKTQPDQYKVFIAAKTRGLLGRLAPWSGTFETHGAVKSGALIPRQHKSVGTWRGEAETKDYQYHADGRFKDITIYKHDEDPKISDISAEVTDNTIDALTAALMVFENYNKDQKCEGTSKVFDGKRSYTQIFAHQENVALKRSKFNVYEGPAAECTIEVVPLKGKWYAKPRGWLSIQEQGRDRGTMPTLWLASLTEGAPAVPVKIRVKTDYGTLFMHLAQYQNADGEIIKAKKRFEVEATPKDQSKKK